VTSLREINPWGGRFLIYRGSWALLRSTFWLENLPLQSTKLYKQLSSFFMNFVPNYVFRLKKGGKKLGVKNWLYSIVFGIWKPDHSKSWQKKQTLAYMSRPFKYQKPICPESDVRYLSPRCTFEKYRLNNCQHIFELTLNLFQINYSKLTQIRTMCKLHVRYEKKIFKPFKRRKLKQN
jgi:hypothetical protein